MTSLVIEGAWAAMTDSANILEHGLWYGFDYKAMISVGNSAMGGLTVAAVLKFADAVLKGYATAISVLLTGVMSMLLFGTSLNAEHVLGMVNVLAAVILYNAKNLDANAWRRRVSRRPLDRPSG
ncbi:pyrimidine nucleotide-sugar transmembrane transporter [Aureococcus anophagefferens]|nr:pyrimidine nucleotide-sugar transmembrane transporter [Aureococcus anophagefferens]